MMENQQAEHGAGGFENCELPVTFPFHYIDVFWNHLHAALVAVVLVQYYAVRGYHSYLGVLRIPERL
jgi:hypothetical protein